MAEREQHPQQQPKAEKYQKPEKELKQLVRVVNTDLDGARSVFLELSKVKGVGFSFAHAVCTVLNIDKSAVLGSLDDKKFSQIEEVIKNPEKFNIPQWMLNRRREYETGESHHLVTTDIGLAEDNDMKRMKMMKSYRGIRHIMNLPVRGQRTKSNFRKNKGNVLGVKRRASAKAGK